ncbi:MAG: ferredoxin family protein [Sulfuricurvum sp.]|nr:ferredoxin family protein [Campylobacterales bacterium]MBD3810079.1 ferredoxin family protein [Sulfuricurvum sp.]
MQNPTPSWHGIERTSIPWYPTVNPDQCIGCELCFVTCGKSVYAMGEIDHKRKALVNDPYACVVGCTTCANICPTHAIGFPDPIIVLNAEREHKIFSQVHKEADARREKITQRNTAIQTTPNVVREKLEIAGEVEKLNLSSLRALVAESGCDLIDISITIPSILEHTQGAPGIAKMTLIGAPDQIGSVSEALNTLIYEHGLTLSKHDKG